jgi:hypothetical protein
LFSYIFFFFGKINHQYGYFLPGKDMNKEKEREAPSSQVVITLSRVERVGEIIEHNSALLSHILADR